jgi:putative ABC transport system ATP-binding protein
MTLTELDTHLRPSMARSPDALVAHDLSRSWGSGSNAHVAVAGVTLTVGRGEFLAIVGPSGSGKSTLGAILAGIDRPDAGSVTAFGRRIDKLRDDALARWRGQHVGIVFQDFNLIPTLNAVENVQLALRLTGVRAGRCQAQAALASVGLGGHAKRLPSQLSGGEQQRVAVARALVRRPDLVVADEPTGSLDSASGAVVFDLLCELKRSGTTVVLITHDQGLARSADRVLEMVDGRVVSEMMPS